MKVLVLLLATITFSSLTFAADPAPAGQHPQEHKEDFEKHKQEHIHDLEERINNLQSFKTCLSDAHDHDGMKKCHEENEKREKELQAKHKDQRKHEIDERIKQLQDEKTKLTQ